MRRVVVTGLGAVTPIGNNVEEFWNGIKAGKCGIDKVTLFDATDFKTQIAGEVKNAYSYFVISFFRCLMIFFSSREI